MKSLSLFFIFMSFGLVSFSQPGVNCATPYDITTLPFIETGFTTAGFGNDYTSANACGSTYMGGMDFVFEYTPATSMNVTVKLTGTSAFTGVFIVEGCPDSPTAVCIAQKTEPGGNPVIATASLTMGVTYYIIVDTYNVLPQFGTTAFNIELSEVFANDAATMMVFQPRSRCSLSNLEPVIGLFKNKGTQTITSMQVGYSINGQAPVIENFTASLAPGAENYHHFSQKPNMTAPGQYDIKVFSILPGDEFIDNDTISFPIYQNTTVSAFPYLDDFETANSGWIAQWISQTNPGTSWEQGIPSATVINAAASGTQCWATNLSGNALLPEDSYVQSPCFNFSAVSNPVLELDIWYQTGTADLAYIEYSIDDAFTWTLVGTYNSGINWYNVPGTFTQTGWNGSSAGWIHARQTLDALGGESNVIFRIVYLGSPQIPSEGIAIDNFKISESPVNDLSVFELLNPVSDCGMTTDSITVKITNKGLDAQTGFDIAYSINGGLNWVTENITQTLNFQDTITYTFTTHADFSINGLYPVIVKTMLVGDQFPVNDSVYSPVMSFPVISTMPYINNFETNNGYWIADGLNSTWQWGVPTETTMDHAASGTKAWVTNLSGNHAQPEASSLTGPCVDVTGMNNPQVKMKIWSETQNPGYCQLQYLPEGSTGWATLGSSLDTNWYPAGYSWTGSTGDWISVSHHLSGIGNNFSLRLNFQSPLASPGFGFDDFTICDAPLASFNQLFTTKSLESFQLCVDNTSLNATDSVRWTTSDGQTSTANMYCFSGYTSTTQAIVVTLIAYNSCGSDTIVQILNPSSNDVVEIEADKLIRIYPSPFSDYITLETFTDIIRWELTDIAGRIITESAKEITTGEKYNIPTEMLNAGTYILRAVSSDKQTVKRLINKQ